MMTVMEKVKSFFKRPESKDKAGQPQSAAEKKATDDPQKETGKAGGQQSGGTT